VNIVNAVNVVNIVNAVNIKLRNCAPTPDHSDDLTVPGFAVNDSLVAVTTFTIFTAFTTFTALK
jgi:hypothetical protein